MNFLKNIRSFIHNLTISLQTDMDSWQDAYQVFIRCLFKNSLLNT